MMSLETIQQQNEIAEQQAREEGIEPYVARYDGDDGVRAAPYIGNYQPEGWTRTEEFFVDSSGFGGPDEPAMTFEQFLNHVKDGCGYAIISAGQFQVYIQEFAPEGN